MTSSLLRKILVLCFCLGCHHLAFAAATKESVASVVREAFAVRPFNDIDLPQASVRAVHVGRKGYLWAGTREGLVQYKAGQQTTWRQTTDGLIGLPSGVVNTIYEDRQGTIWVGTARGVAKRTDGADSFSVVIQSADDDAEQLDILEFVEFQETLIGVSASGDLLIINDESVETAEGLGELFQETLTSATVKDNALFLGTLDGQIYQLTREDGQFEVIDIRQSKSPVVALHSDGSSLFWLDREYGLFWTGAENAQKLYSTDPVSEDAQGYFRAMKVIDSENAWFAAGPTVIRRKDGRTDVVRLPGRGNEVRSIDIDPVGNIWIGTYYGLYYALDTDFTVLETASAFDAGVILSLAASGDELFLGGQNLWTGSLDANNFSELRLSLPAVSGASLRIDPQAVGQSPITALTATEQSLLVGYLVGGMDVLDRQNGRSTNIMSYEGESLKGIGVSAFAQVSEQVFLASFYLFGLMEVRITNLPDAPPQVSLTRISRHETLIGIYRVDANRYIAIDQQVIILIERDPEGQYQVQEMENTSRGIVFAVEADGQGGVFLGIENAGVQRLTAETLARGQYTPESIPIVEQYLANSTIWHLLVDNDGLLWVTTNQGLYTFDLQAETLPAHITYAGGLPADEFDYGSHARLLAPNGDRLFVSAKVPVVFEHPPGSTTEKIQLFWTDVLLNGKALGTERIKGSGSSFRLNAAFKDVSSGRLRIDYGYSDHVRTQGLDYALRIGAEKNWTLQRNPSVVVTRQQYWGSVPIHIAMLDANGEVASETLTLTLDIAPPAYMLWIIDLRYAVPALLAVALLLYAMQVRGQQRQRAIRLEAERKRELLEAEMRGRVSEKEILLRELHHRVGNLLASFSSNIRAMQRSARQEETRDSLRNLDARLKVQSAVHRLLQRSDRTDINVAAMIRQVSHGVCDLFQQQDSRPLDIELDDVFMTYSRAQYLGLIVNELLTNSFRHARNTASPVLASMRLTIDRDSGEISFHYRDFGPGIDEQVVGQATEQKRYSERKGLAQVVGLAQELSGNPRLYNDEGMHFELTMEAPPN